MPPVLLPQPQQVEWSGRLVTPLDVAEGRDERLPAQGYRLTIGERAVRLDAADDAGAFYGRATLEQLRRAGDGSGGELPEGTIHDWPDLAVRGVMFDVSRDKVPSLETLEALINRLASWKVNHVELYLEHTFAYADHEEVWAAASPYTPDDIERLDRFCRRRFIELTPHQNCLGHFERWLAHDRYQSLAIAPDGWSDARGRWRRPTTLEPTNADARALIGSLLDELLRSFSSSRVHVGLDEPWELPDARFGDYLDYVRNLRERPEIAGREMLIWGDIVASHPERLTEIPDGVTVCEWGYEAGHPFAERAAVLAESGRPFWLCPGTSSWNSIVGRTTNMRDNCREAAVAAVDAGASGLLVTDWGDNGHVQQLPISAPGFAYGAAVAWCVRVNAEIDLAAALSAHAFDDDTGELAAALLALGDAHRSVVPQMPNTSVLALPLLSPRFRMGEGRTAGLTDDDLREIGSIIAAARAGVARSNPRCADGAAIIRETDAGAALVDLLVRDTVARLAAGGTIEAVPVPIRRAFADELADLTETHRRLWSDRNRPGGLDDSCNRLDALRDTYLA